MRRGSSARTGAQAGQVPPAIAGEFKRLWKQERVQNFFAGRPQKARLVIDMIRGKNVNQALAILRYSNKRAALGIEKCVKSAIANANEAAEKANVSVDPDDLWLKAAYVDRGRRRIVVACVLRRRAVRIASAGTFAT